MAGFGFAFLHVTNNGPFGNKSVTIAGQAGFMKLLKSLSRQAGHFGRFLSALAGAATLAVGARAADSTALSDILEKAIYSEESQGDIDGAMKLYQQVVSEGKKGQAAGAQAQYRLGVCFYKKKDYDQANAAFEKVVKDFPEQKELVALAQDYLAGAVALTAAPWADGEEMRLDLKFPSGFRIGVASYTVASGETNGHKIWRFGSRMMAGVQQFSRVEADYDSLKPLHSRWKHVLIADAEAVYSPGRAEVKLLTKDTIKTVDLQGVIYDNEEATQLFRRLPLATNYSGTLRFLSTLSGGNIIPVKIDVPTIEKVQVPAGTFECFKLDLSIRQTFWYSTDPHRYLVKFEAGGVIAELSGIGEFKPDAPTAYRDPSYKFGVTLPPTWTSYRRDPDEEKQPTTVFLLDPDAAALTVVQAQKREWFKPETKESITAWAKAELVDAAKELKDFKAREEKEMVVGGHPALAVIGDFMDGKDKSAAYRVFLFSGDNAFQISGRTTADNFESWKAQVDTIVQSFKD